MTAATMGRRIRDRMGEIRLSRRERLLLLGLVAFLSLVWAVTSFDKARGARSIAENARVSLSQEQARQAQLASVAFQSAMAREADKARAWSLGEPTVYIAQMRAQSQLEDFAIAAGVANHEIIVDRPEPAEAGVQRLPLAIEGDFDRATFLTLLSFLEAAEPGFVPVMAEVTSASAEPRFSLALAAAYIAPEGRR